MKKTFPLNLVYRNAPYIYHLLPICSFTSLLLQSRSVGEWNFPMGTVKMREQLDSMSISDSSGTPSPATTPSSEGDKNVTNSPNKRISVVSDTWSSQLVPMFSRLRTQHLHRHEAVDELESCFSYVDNISPLSVDKFTASIVKVISTAGTQNGITSGNTS